MKIILFLTLISIITIQAINAQDEQPYTLIRINHISKIEAFIFLSPEKKMSIDSHLITTEYFNALGYRTKIEIFDSAGLLNSYEYLYKDDSIRTQRLTFFKNILQSKSRIYYNIQGKEKKAVDYSANGHKTGTRSRSKYNKKGQLKEVAIWFSGKLSVKKKYKYAQDGRPEEMIQILPEKLIKKYTPDQLYPGTENIDRDGRKMRIQKLTFPHLQTILGLAGDIKLKEGDELETRIYYKENGLIDFEEQYKNGIFLARKKYKYFP